MKGMGKLEDFEKKEIEEDIDKWKNIPCPWMIESTSLKCPYYPRQSIGPKQSISKYKWHIS